ncbi:hypothetical protein A6R68_05310 [Neotoma lepida]|uniref:MHC class II alpha chain N-terminal domain-containing protein n=1 Tax=Neotoma lepida TaxID=56216 RepID=A0A1A6GK86_NEOLE|nr:hypothetical protein A6R68_05310 [Neotoma lepida]
MDHEQKPGARLLQLLQFLWLLPHSWAVPEVCLQGQLGQDIGNPSIGLSESYDEDQLFSYDFSQNTRVPRLPDFADWAQEQGDASAISFDQNFCEILVQQLQSVCGVCCGKETVEGIENLLNLMKLQGPVGPTERIDGINIGTCFCFKLLHPLVDPQQRFPALPAFGN